MLKKRNINLCHQHDAGFTVVLPREGPYGAFLVSVVHCRDPIPRQTLLNWEHRGIAPVNIASTLHNSVKTQ